MGRTVKASLFSLMYYRNLKPFLYDLTLLVIHTILRYKVCSITLLCT